jgi:hypothetical protein
MKFQIGDLLYRPSDLTTFAIEKKLGLVIGIDVDDGGFEYLTIRWNDGFRMESLSEEARDSIKYGYWIHYPVKVT